MAYTVLARRYRSSTFDEVVGQKHVAQTLKRAIESSRIAHAFMFCGTRGTGKTSMARILAKALNCEKSDKPTVTPCGQCRSCQAIARGEDIDVIEIDAASNRGIDEVRRIIENSRLAPARSRYKVYIIDEVHAMSKDAFNALLKVLEEPAPHVKFILATTEPEKVLATILSRCQRYDFHNIPVRDIASHLKEICQREGVKAQEDAVVLIAKAGNGSMRDALSVLDRLLSAGCEELTIEMIEQMLGLPRSQVIFDLVQAIGSSDIKGTLSLLNTIIFQGLSVDTLLVCLIDHLRNLLIIRTCGLKNDLVEAYGINPADLQKQAERFDPITLTQDIVILEELRRAARQSQASRALLDATMVRLALAEQFTPSVELLEQSASSSAADQAAKKKVEPLTLPPVAALEELPAPQLAATESLTPTPENPAPESSATDESSLDDDDALPSVGKVWDTTPARSLSSILAGSSASRKSTPSPSSPNSSAPSAPDFWPTLLETVKTRLGAGVFTTLLSSQPTVADGKLILRFSGAFVSMVRWLEKSRDQIQQLVVETSGQSLALQFAVDDTAAPPPTASSPAPRAPNSPAAPLPPSSATPPREALTPELRAQLEKDPLIRALLEAFGGNIVKYE